MIEAENKTMVTRGWRGRNEELLFSIYKVTVLQDKLSSGDQLCKHRAYS